MKGVMLLGGLAAALVVGVVGPGAAVAGTTIDEGATQSRGKQHGLVYLRAQSQLVSNGIARGVVAECDGERTTTGGGAVVQGTTGVPFADSGPTAGFSKARAWVATFTNTTPAGELHVASHAVCGKLEGREVRQKTVEDAPGNAELRLRAPCPAGTKVTGGGVAFADDGSQSRVLEPFDNADSNLKPDDGWRVVAYPASTGAVTATAICARGTYAYRTDTLGPFPTSTLASPQPGCQDGEAVTGGGVGVGGPGPEARIVHSLPEDGPDPQQVPDDRWDTGVEIPFGKTATGVAICKK